MQELKEINEKAYFDKIKNKWKVNPEIYEKFFYTNKETRFRNFEDHRKNKFIRQRQGVQSFLSSGCPVRRNKGRGGSPEYGYSLIFLRNHEKQQMKTDLKKVFFEET